MDTDHCRRNRGAHTKSQGRTRHCWIAHLVITVYLHNDGTTASLDLHHLCNICRLLKGFTASDRSGKKTFQSVLSLFSEIFDQRLLCFSGVPLLLSSGRLATKSSETDVCSATIRGFSCRRSGAATRASSSFTSRSRRWPLVTTAPTPVARK